MDVVDDEIPHGVGPEQEPCGESQLSTPEEEEAAENEAHRSFDHDVCVECEGPVPEQYEHFVGSACCSQPGHGTGVRRVQGDAHVEARRRDGADDARRSYSFDHACALLQHHAAGDRTPLLWGGARVDLTKQDGDTPLHAAASKGHVAVPRLLVEPGANAPEAHVPAEAPADALEAAFVRACLQLVARTKASPSRPSARFVFPPGRPRTY